MTENVVGVMALLHLSVAQSCEEYIYWTLLSDVYQLCQLQNQINGSLCKLASEFIPIVKQKAC